MSLIRYTIDREGEPCTFEIDRAQGAIEKTVGEPPHWALLDHHRCGVCTLPDGEGVPCPAARSLEPVIRAFGRRFSYEEVAVTVEMDGRTISSSTSLQEAVGSLAGLILALSACPVMMNLRPMAHFHLPFSRPEDTAFRVVGMYLLGQYIRNRQGLSPDWDLRGLAGLYERIHQVNEGMAARLRSAAEKDVAVNSLIMLDIFAQAVDRDLETELAGWRDLFGVYLSDREEQ